MSMFAPIVRMFQDVSTHKSYACGEKRKQETERRLYEVTMQRDRVYRNFAGRPGPDKIR